MDDRLWSLLLRMLAQQFAIDPKTDGVVVGRSQNRPFRASLRLLYFCRHKGIGMLENTTAMLWLQRKKCGFSVYRALGQGDALGRIVPSLVRPLENDHVRRCVPVDASFLLCFAEFCYTGPPLKPHRGDAPLMKSKSLLSLVLALLLAATFGFAQSAPAASSGQAKSSKAAKTSAGKQKLDINTASKDRLDALPGIGAAYSQKIIDGRPYNAKNDLVRRNIVPQATYDGIKDQIIAHRGGDSSAKKTSAKSQ
jgi:DNA uptake protein ComE-like DNA-binding protein